VSDNTNEPLVIPDDIAKMNFEDALSALEAIVQNLESGQVSLEESIDIYTRGTQLRQHCDLKLKNASARIEKITRLQGGALATEPLDDN